MDEKVVGPPNRIRIQFRCHVCGLGVHSWAFAYCLPRDSLRQSASDWVANQAGRAAYDMHVILSPLCTNTRVDIRFPMGSETVQSLGNG